MDAQSEAFQKTLQQFGRSILFWFALVASLAFLFGLFNTGKKIVFCGAETISSHLRRPVFRSGNTIITGGDLQSSEYAFEGEHSVKLTPEKQFGLSFEIPNLKGHEQITISVWRYAKGEDASPGIIVGNIKGQYWEDCPQVVEEKNGWQKVECVLDPTFSCRGKDLSIYCWNRGIYPIYFDNMEVTIRKAY